MAEQWTTEQKQAIAARGGNILVSAAAGSGKTAVLVERVIQRLTDPGAPVSADRLLIVTFTRAAATEIRTRISDAVERRIANEPGNEQLIRQQMLLPYAKICTIDAFCNQFCREHFEALQLSPDFKTADDGELQLLSEQAMTLALEECYGKQNGDFLRLVELMFRGRDDSFLQETVRSLYETSRSYPFPDRWLAEIGNAYQSSMPLQDNPFFQTLLSTIEELVDYVRQLLTVPLGEIRNDAVLKSLFEDVFCDDLRQLETVASALQKGDWDKAREAVQQYNPMRRPSVPKEHKDDFGILRLIAIREEAKKAIRDKLAPLFCTSVQEFEDDLRYLAPMIEQLIAITNCYASAFSALKEEKQLADFSDIMHFTLQLLYDTDGDTPVPSALAKAVADDFDEILIDEYQDTNKAQDMLFTAIAKDNLFRVGDVKQSIYRFRQAMPEIFMALKDAYKSYDPEQPQFPAKIVLKHNFRSRFAVTETVNFVFSQLMSRKAGDVDYNGEEKLVCAAQYPQTQESCELHVIDLQSLDSELDSSDAYQADYVASIIRNMLDSGFCVTDHGVRRPAQYQDFCILLRSINGGRGAVYAEALGQRNIPCFTEIETDFFSANEVSLVLNLLRVIDNPKQDIALLSVLLSVLFGFTVDDMASVRLCDPAGDLYHCLLRAAEEGDRKSKHFLQKIESWRTLGVCMSVSDFLRTVYDETALFSAVSAMPGAEKKQMNLSLLLDYAAIYEAAGYIGLSGFIRFIDRLEQAGSDLAGAAGVSAESNVVKIMSIHKSKGLEFPVCIVANCSGKINTGDAARRVVIQQRLGIGVQKRDVETMAQYPTLPLIAAREESRKDTMSEELRVLYVAMTRAREKLILVGACRDLEKTMQKYQPRLLSKNGRMQPFAVQSASSYSDWLFPALLRHPDAKKLREAGGFGEEIVLPASFRLDLHLSAWQERTGAVLPEETLVPPDPAFLQLAAEQLGWRYAYEPLTKLVSKRAASEVDKDFVDRDYFATSMPAFLEQGGLSAAQRGTATHTFMQYCDFARAKHDVPGEIERLRDLGVISDAEAAAINRRAVKRFFESDLFRRMEQSKLVMREKKFTIEVPVTTLYEGLEAFEDEKVMIQGIADCAFLENGKLVVVDYKTDRLDEESAFKDKYRAQVSVYKTALSMCTDYEVSQTLLYSFHLSKAITVEA